MPGTLLQSGPLHRLHGLRHLLRRLRHRLRRAAAAALALAMLAGCQSIDMNSAQLRVLDASPDAGPIDAYQNNIGLAYNLSFGTITSYVPMAPGSYSLSADKAGSHQALLTGNGTLAPGHQYTEVIGNIAAGLQQTLLVDQTQPAPAGETALRFLQEAPRSGSVDIYLVPKGARLGGLTPIAANVGFGALSAYFHEPAGTYAIDVVPAGTALQSSTVTLLSGAQIAYDSGSVRTVVILDQPMPTAQEDLGTPHAGVQTLVADDVDAYNN